MEAALAVAWVAWVVRVDAAALYRSVLVIGSVAMKGVGITTLPRTSRACDVAPRAATLLSLLKVA